MIAGRLELRLLLFIVGHGKVFLLIVGWPQTVHVPERCEKKFVSVPGEERYSFKV